MNSYSSKMTALRTQATASWPLVLGFLALYYPTLSDLATGLWSSEAFAHGPIILCLSIWLLIRQWPVMKLAVKKTQDRKIGWPFFIFGLLLYIIGRSQAIIIFELGSLIILIASILLIMYGKPALRAQWFPLFFMCFMVPLPGTFVDALTLPMKLAVSYVTEHVLFWFGYIIARNGVILQIGQYQLMVADACAGLQTLLTLEALGLFYLNLVRHNSAFRNITLAVLIVPISFTANVIRVISLTLITFHFGDEAGQGFLHGFAGMVLFISALVLIIGTDSILQFILGKRFLGKSTHQASAV